MNFNSQSGLYEQHDSGRSTGCGGGVVPDLSRGVVTQTYWVLEQRGESIPFGLTPEEKQSIETDIRAKKLIGVGDSANAYKKFLKGVLGREVSVLPYLENYYDALKIIEGLKQLFPEQKNIRLANEGEVVKSIKENKHFTGQRIAGTQNFKHVGSMGLVWIDGQMKDGCAPCLGINSSSLLTALYGFHPMCCYSVIPVFG